MFSVATPRLLITWSSLFWSAPISDLVFDTDSIADLIFDIASPASSCEDILRSSIPSPNVDISFTSTEILLNSSFVSPIEEEAVFANQLQTLKIPHTFILNEGKHDEEYWKMHLRDYLIWYAEALETD